MAMTIAVTLATVFECNPVASVYDPTSYPVRTIRFIYSLDLRTFRQIHIENFLAGYFTILAPAKTFSQRPIAISILWYEALADWAYKVTHASTM